MKLLNEEWPDLALYQPGNCSSAVMLTLIVLFEPRLMFNVLLAELIAASKTDAVVVNWSLLHAALTRGWYRACRSLLH